MGDHDDDSSANCDDDSALDRVRRLAQIGWFGLGLFGGFLAFTGLSLAWTEANSGNGGGASENGNDETDPKELTARLFELPGGRWIAGLIAIGVLVVAGVRARCHGMPTFRRQRLR